MAILKTYIPTVHDIHTYAYPATLNPRLDASPFGLNLDCHAAHILWNGVSIRPRAFCRTIGAAFQTSWTAPYEAENINFWNTCNPTAVLISPKHALICQHYRGTHDRPEEYYTFLGRSGAFYTGRVLKAYLNIGPDHTLIEFQEPFITDVPYYSKIADVKYIPTGTPLWIHECNGKAYKMIFGQAQLSTAGSAVQYTYGPSLDPINIGITANGWPAIFGGDSGSPTFIDYNGTTIFVGLMHGGMQVNDVELAAINALLQPQGYSVEHFKVSAKPADLNQDGLVDGSDLAKIISAWGNGSALADLNKDGVVDSADLSELLASWGAYAMQTNFLRPPTAVQPDNNANIKPRS
jgi:hypothetical protein